MKEWIIGLLCAGWAFFTPVHTAVIGVFIMVFADLITGMCSSCVTVYKNSTVMQYKGQAELMTDSVKISVNNKQLIEE